MICCKDGCGSIGVHARNKGGGHTSHYCSRHYRIDRMISEAKGRGKTAPTRDELDKLIPDGMRCPKCGIVMNWNRSEGHATTLTLQHWRDGSFGVLCLSCNVRHRDMPDDESFMSLPTNHKRCPDCADILPSDAFGYRANGNPHSYCKPCLSVRNQRN